MKSYSFLLAILLLFAGFASSCSGRDSEKYPVTTLIGERTCVGEIAGVPIPIYTEPPLPGLVAGLETADGDYVLVYNGNTYDNEITVEGVVYSIGDEVEITGIVSITKVSSSRQFSELEIKSIKKTDL